MPPVTRSQAAKNSATGTEVAEYLQLLDGALALITLRYGDGSRVLFAKRETGWTRCGPLPSELNDNLPIAHRLPLRACRQKTA